MTEPTEISIPPVEITSVIPIPQRMVGQSWVITLFKFPILKKFGVNKEFNSTKNRSSVIALYFFTN